MRYFIILTAAVALLLGCEKQEKAEQVVQEQPQTVEQAKFKLAELETNICPACGMILKTDAEVADTVHYADKVYGFCGPKCVDTFKANPEKTLAALHERMEKMEGMHKEGEHEEGHEHMHNENDPH
ncbi:hypothetical protein [Caldithrix abyssi]